MAVAGIIFHTKAFTAAVAAKSLQSCLTLCDLIDGSPPGSPVPWDSPGKNTGVGCHFLLQCMKVKSESEVAQSCLTLSDPMDCSPPGSSIHGIFQARVLEWGAIAFSAIQNKFKINFELLYKNKFSKDKLWDILEVPLYSLHFLCFVQVFLACLFKIGSFLLEAFHEYMTIFGKSLIHYTKSLNS